MKKIVLNEFFGGDPELLTMVVNDLILVWVSVDGVSTGWSVEKVWE